MPVPTFFVVLRAIPVGELKWIPGQARDDGVGG